jgi:hypothetical protein
MHDELRQRPAPYEVKPRCLVRLRELEAQLAALRAGVEASLCAGGAKLARARAALEMARARVRAYVEQLAAEGRSDDR